MPRMTLARKMRSGRRWPLPARFLITLVLALAAPGLLAQEASFRIVTHPSNPATTVGKEEASRLFLKKALIWKDGTKALPIDLGEASKTRAAFCQEIHGRPVRSVKAYWLNQVFGGRLTPPAEVATDADVLTFVKANPGALGYVAADAPVKGVKVLEVTAGP